jgi:hypothetical protein
LRLLSLYNILSDERMGLSFTIAAVPRHRRHSRIQVIHDHILPSQIRDSPNLEDQVAYLYPHALVSFRSPPPTPMATVEVFEPASTLGSRWPVLFFI